MDGEQLDREMRRLAAQQHALVASAQAIGLGATPQMLDHRVDSGAWERSSGRVLRLAGSVPTFRQQVMSGVLDAGPHAVASHETALALFGLPGFESVGLHVSRQRGRSGRAAGIATLHQPRHLAPHHVVVVDGVPVTTAARSLFDCAGRLHPGRAERAVDNALARGTVRLDALRRVTIELLEHGRGGSALMRRLLDERDAGFIPRESSHERRLFALLAAAGDPLPDGQVDLGGEEGWIRRADAYYREARLDIEVDGDLGHAQLLDVLDDRRRDARLRAAGIEVLRVTEHDLRDAPAVALERIRTARAQRLHPVLAPRCDPLGSHRGARTPAS